MSMDPGTMQQMLMQRLQQSPQGATAGGGAAGPMMQGNTGTPMGISAQVAQKIMLMKALQGQQQTQQANAMLPGTNAMIAHDPTMQAMQQPPQMPPPQMPPSQ